MQRLAARRAKIVAREKRGHAGGPLDRRFYETDAEWENRLRDMIAPDDIELLRNPVPGARIGVAPGVISRILGNA